jgi:hypothetical protein
MRDLDLIVRQLPQRLARRIGQVGEALGELRARQRLDLVEHHHHHVVVEADLLRRVLFQAVETVTQRTEQNASLFARAFPREGLQLLQRRQHGVDRNRSPSSLRIGSIVLSELLRIR